MKNNFTSDQRNFLTSNGYVLEISGIYRRLLGGSVSMNTDGDIVVVRLGQMSFFSDLEVAHKFLIRK